MAETIGLIFIFVLAIQADRFIDVKGDTSKPKEVCEFGKLVCDDGLCIKRKNWCDGQMDCFDGSDEQYCQSRDAQEASAENINNCLKELHFQCHDGKCIPKSARCDDFPDCSVGDDEENCDYYFEWNEDGTSTTETSTTSTTTSTTTQPDTVPTSTKFTTRYLLNQRDSHWGWGKSTAQMIVALHLVNKTYFDPGNIEGQLAKKEMEVLFAIDMMRKAEVHLHLPELSHYLHAFLVTCHSPKNFHGVNLIKLLKKEIHRRRKRKLFVTPLAYLALCNAGEVADSFIRRMKNMAYRRSEEQRWLDIQAYALLTISCYSKRNDTSAEWKLLKQDVAKNLTDWQQVDGSFGSVYSTGLALQALIAAEEPGTEVPMDKAKTYLTLKEDWEGSFGSDLDNFYVLPALNRKSLVDVVDRECKEVHPPALNIEADRKGGKKGKKHVHYSLWIGGEKNEMHTITLSVPIHSNFVEVMDAAEKINPKYSHEMWMGSRGPVVYSIAGRKGNVEKSLYWTLYRKVPLPFRPVLSNSTATAARLRLFGASKYIKDIRKLHPRDGEHLAFWLKSYA